jgi:hypothetical protein
VGGGKVVRRGYTRVKILCTQCYENGKMKPVETIPRMGVGRIKENDGGVNSTIIHCKNFCKCHNVPPAQ